MLNQNDIVLNILNAKLIPNNVFPWPCELVLCQSVIVLGYVCVCVCVCGCRVMTAAVAGLEVTAGSVPMITLPSNANSSQSVHHCVCVWMGTQVCCCVICTLSERLLTQPGWLEGRTLEWRCYQLCNNPQDHPSDTRTTGCCEYITQEITATGLHSSRGKSSVYGKQVHLV